MRIVLLKLDVLLTFWVGTMLLSGCWHVRPENEAGPGPDHASPERFERRGTVPSAALSVESGRVLFHSPFVVLPASPGWDRDSGAATLRNALALGARFVLVVGAGAPSDDAPPRLSTPGSESVMVSFPVNQAPSGPVLQTFRGEGQHLILVRWRGMAVLEPRNVDTALRRALKQSGNGVSIVVFDVPPWRHGPMETWSRARRTLAKGAGHVLAVALTDSGSPDSFWWDATGRVERLQVPVTGAEASSRFFFGRVSGKSVKLSVLEASSVRPVSAYSRSFIDKRETMRRSLSLTPICNRNRATVVTLTNPFDRKLNVSARWHFVREGYRVEPQLVGFELEPGGVFRQQFTFQPEDGAGPLKFALPRFELRTEVKSPAGIGQPVTLEATAPVCMQVAPAELDTPPVVDGTLEWDGSRHRLGDPAQVVEGHAEWEGAQDASANLRFAYANDTLFIGARIRDDDDRGMALTVFFDPRGSLGQEINNDEFGEDEAPLELTFELSETALVDIAGPNASEEDIKAAAAKGTEDWEVEISMPLPQPAPDKPGTLRMEAVLTDEDAGGATTVLAFSGAGNPRRSSARYARIHIPTPAR